MAANVVNTGYTFAGWYEKSALTGTAVTNIPVGTTGDKIYYAKYTPNEYTITYTANGGTGADQTQDVTYDADFTTKGLGTFTKTGYTLTGWSVSSGATGSYTGLSTKYQYVDAKDITLSAEWQANTYGL